MLYTCWCYSGKLKEQMINLDGKIWLCVHIMLTIIGWRYMPPV